MHSMKIAILVAVWLLARSMAWAQIEPMNNDDCTGSKVLSPGTNPSAPSGLSGNFYTNVGASPSGSPSLGLCGTAGDDDVWFSYFSPVGGATVISTCTPAGFSPGSLADTILTVYSTIPFLTSCTQAILSTCNDNACMNRSSVSVSIMANSTYYVRIAGAGGSNGTFYVVVTPPPLLPGDECSVAIPLAYGPNGPYFLLAATGISSVGSPCGSPGYRDLWFSIISTTCGPLTVDTCGTFDSMVQAFSACGGTQLACNNDGGSGCSPGSRITFLATPGTSYLIRASSVDPFILPSASVTVTVAPGLVPMTLAWSSPLGPGSIAAVLSSGPGNGTYFLAATVVAGSYPYGWLFGLDISYADLATQLSTGFPFFGPLGSCGDFTLGPFQGLPSGFTLYSIAFGLVPGASVPATHSLATSYTVP